MTNEIRIVIGDFQCYEALWLTDMPVYLLETERASN